MEAKLHPASRIVWKQCIKLKPREEALVVTDHNRMVIAESLWWTAQRINKDCSLLLMKPGKVNGEEPPGYIARAMLKADAIVCPTTVSLTHTVAVRKAAARGARVITMPGITEKDYITNIPVSYRKLGLTNRKLMAKLEGAEWLHISTRKGTSIQLNIKGRKLNNCDGMADRPGKVTNLPDGEVAAAPIEGLSEGVIVVDLTSMHGLVEKPFRIRVEKGRAVSCTDKKLWSLLTSAKNGTNLAEVGIGTNYKARVSGSTLVDEKILGTCHIAFGTSRSLGGKVQSSIHLDQIFSKPTIEADGRLIMKEGRLI